jgi:short subunit dehydrogenase-like uncharacterized protein
MRQYDLVLFGASGFTGRQAAAYVASHAPPGLRWAIAGRDRRRLEALRVAADLIVADSHDPVSIAAMAGATRVILSTAGPFAKYGTAVVDACVRLGTDYVDITGETLWVEELVAQYHEAAEATRVRIVPCCGFDSVPSDLGAFLLATHHRARDVRAYFQFGGGGLNGGTVASVSNMVQSRHAGQVTRGVMTATPRYDVWIGTWVGPFFMAPTNTWVVRRSAALFGRWHEPYPEEFNYSEFLRFDPPMAAGKAIAASTAIAALGLALRVPPLFRALEHFMPKPGEGPTEQQMDRGWFSCDVLGQLPNGTRVSVRLANRGDAGNRSTVKMLCESAFCLTSHECTTRGGILTPATAFGSHLVRRLRAAGMVIDCAA